MAKPSFIYAFDNLGPEKFVELCGLLLASRYQGFLLGGVGPDGGVDAEIDDLFGQWNPEYESALLDEAIQPNSTVVFQFKHKVTARVGQSASRSQLLNLFKCTDSRTCELHRDLLVGQNLSAYVLVTNVEVNSQFRESFIERCRDENPRIEHYQIVGLDELEMWVTMEPLLRHQFFPTIFGVPRFNLSLDITTGFYAPYYGDFAVDAEQAQALLQVRVMNIGTEPSYVNAIKFRVITENGSQYFGLLNLKRDEVMEHLNPERGSALNPGRGVDYHFRFTDFLPLVAQTGIDLFPTEVIVTDEIGNMYSAPIPPDLRENIQVRLREIIDRA